MARLSDENLIITKTLLRRFELEAFGEDGDGRFYALILRSNGDLIAHNPGSPELAAEQSLWAGDVLKFLNRELHHDGAWVLVFTHPKRSMQDNPLLASNLQTQYARYVMLWLDQDGDVQIPIEWMEGTADATLRDFADVMLAGMDCAGQAAEFAYQAWNELMVKVLDRREGDTYKRARGEQAPSSRAVH